MTASNHWAYFIVPYNDQSKGPQQGHRVQTTGFSALICLISFHWKQKKNPWVVGPYGKKIIVLWRQDQAAKDRNEDRFINIYLWYHLESIHKNIGSILQLG